MTRLALVLAVIALALPVGALAGVRLSVITGGSMGDTVPLGSLVLGRATDHAAVRPGDVLTFRVPGSARDVTHRVTAIDGRGRLITRGDANAADDPWRVGPGTPVRRVLADVPGAGYPVAWLHGGGAIALLAGLLGLGCAMTAVRDLRGVSTEVTA